MLAELRSALLAPGHRLYTNALLQARPGNQKFGARKDAARLILPAATGSHALFELHHGLRQLMIPQRASRHDCQGADDRCCQDTAGAKTGPYGQLHLTPNLKTAAQSGESLSKRPALHRNAMQLPIGRSEEHTSELQSLR